MPPRSRVADALHSTAARLRAQSPLPASTYVERHVPSALRWTLSVLGSVGDMADAALVRLGQRGGDGPPPVCEPDGPAVVIRGTALPGDERRYLVLPFEVVAGTSRLEIDYDWRARPPVPPEGPLTETVLDLGLWDENGYRSAEGFRGWSGRRHKHVFVQADRAQRCYRPGPVGAGVWHVELGLAAIGPTGADWTVTVRAKTGPTGSAPVPDPVDPSHVARPSPGWYHGDFHVHAWHSHPEGPSPEELVRYGRKAKLDFLPVTEYVVGHHWSEYGPVQRANPDILIWPGREIITYYGHVQSLGETPGVIEYRHGFEDVRIGDIQSAVRNAGALFQVNHPTTFPGPLFESFCRGCAFELGEEIDWGAVDTIEVLTGEALVDPAEYGMPDLGFPVPNPFLRTAVDLWEELLNRGFKITAVSGSDDKKGPKLGSCATAVFASELSRPALVEAIREGRAYVRTRGVAGSPALELAAVATGQDVGTFGSTLLLEDPEDTAEIGITVRRGRGQALRVVRNGSEVETVPIRDDPFHHTFTAARVAGEGPLGTWYRVETFDARGPTTIGNPVFLKQAPA